MFNATIIAVTYGLDVHAKPENDKYIQIAEQTMASFHNAFTLGKYHVETFPILKHLPAWFPLAGFKREIPTWTTDARRLRDEPWQAAADAMVLARCTLFELRCLTLIVILQSSGSVTPSMASLLTMDAKTEEDIAIAKSACASAYAGEHI